MTPNLENWEDLQFRNQKLCFLVLLLPCIWLWAYCFLLQAFVFLKGSHPDRRIHQDGMPGRKVSGWCQCLAEPPCLWNGFAFLRLLLLRRTFIYQVLRCRGLLKISFFFLSGTSGSFPLSTSHGSSLFLHWCLSQGIAENLAPGRPSLQICGKDDWI